jgi:hypothetical protein
MSFLWSVSYDHRWTDYQSPTFADSEFLAWNVGDDLRLRVNVRPDVMCCTIDLRGQIYPDYEGE